MPSAAIIGAGVAGINVAAALSSQGWQITLFDSAPRICAGASGNPAGAFHAHLSRDDAPISRLSRLGVAATLESLHELTRGGLLTQGQDWDESGHYQLSENDDDEDRAQETLRRRENLHDSIRWVDATDIQTDLGFLPAHGGLFFSRAGWVNPLAWCKALLENCNTVPRFNSRVAELRLEPGGGVQIMLSTDKNGVPEYIDGGQFDRLVIASADDSLRLLPQPHVQSRCVKGQISLVRAPAPLQRVVSGAAYAIGIDAATWLIGATYERPALDTDVTEQAHALNLARLRAAFSDLPEPTVLGGRSAMRSMWPDRLPAIGPAIDVDGKPMTQIWFATGYGSRGLTWAALAGNILAAWWAGLTPPVPQDLLAAVLPGRFFSRASNSKPTFPSLPSTR